jgi:two-component system KDP operon response regulator KdpE
LLAHFRTPNDRFVMPPLSNSVMLIALPRNRIPANRRVAPLRVADLEIDALDPRVRQGAREVRLSPNEHILLYTLAANAGAVVTYRELTEALGSRGSEVRNNSLARHLSSLRRKLQDDPERPHYIETVRTIGFRFVATPRT